MSGVKQSKTAKASVAAGQKGVGGVGLQKSADAALIIPCGEGQYAYVSTAGGRNMHMKVVSSEFVTEVSQLVSAGYDRVLKEVEKHSKTWPSAGWNKALPVE